MNLCYCGSQKPYSECCEPVHQNHSHAQTPEQLMRARYSAHCLRLVDFIVQTYHPSCGAESQREAIAESVQSNWLKLEVITSDNSDNVNEGFVHFKAYYQDHAQQFCLEERSRFLREDGYWFYIDGEYPEQQPKEKVGRNDPCVCGSGKKYKKCCGWVTQA